MADETTEYETWMANGRIVLRKFNRIGGLEEIMVNIGRKVQLTEQERLMNQEMCVDDALDPFANGTLSPVRLPDSSEETARAIVNSPNTLTEDDMRELLQAHHKTFEKRMAEITSPYVLRRMVAMTKEDDMDLTVKRVQAVEDRLREATADDVPVFEHAPVNTRT